MRKRLTAFSDQIAGFSNQGKVKNEPGGEPQLKTKRAIRLILFIVSCSLFPVHYSAAQITPSGNYPWIKVQTAKVATTNSSDLNDPQKAHTAVQYIDGHGRGLQAVDVAASPLGKDIVSGAGTLDGIGRPDKSYLPVAATSTSGQFFNNLEVTAQSFYGDTKPYSKVAEYEASPMSRALKVFDAGEAFQTSSSQGVRQDYTVAGAGIRKYIYINEQTANIAGSYSDGQLVRTVSKDEDGNETIEFKGSQSGRLVQVHRKPKTGSEYLITAYVYDFMGRLRFIIPPKLFNTNTNISFTTHAEGLYSYRYDSRSRLVESFKPGAGGEYTVYNELGQAVLSQDARLRETNTWLWVKYDGHGRPVMSGTLTTSHTRSQIQGFFDNYSAPEHFEEPSTSGGNLLRYTNRSFPPELPIAESNVLKVNYYDQYEWVNNAALDFQLYQNPRYTNAKGLSTGSMVRRLDTGVWMKTVQYYDDQNRPIQSQTQNRFGSINRTDVAMDFEGKVSEQRTVYRRPAHPDLTVSTAYSYDHAGRQTSATHKVDGQQTPLAKYSYDEVGRLTRKYLGVAEGEDIIIENSPQPGGNQDIAFRYVELQPGMYTAESGTYLAAISPGPIQAIDYSYTIRGQLRGINLNAAGNIPSTPLGLTDGDVFALKLDHHETGQTYNGKLHKQTWQTRSQSSRSFTYGYDGYDRISSATYSGAGAEDYSMPGIDYDANGNLTAFNRRGLASPGNWQSIDILAYNYQNTVSNKLSHIIDYANPNVGFRDNGGFGTDYTYYPDGSLKSDANKGITLIEYNYLGLEKVVHFGSSKRIENIYDAEGVKLEQRLINGGTTHTTEYIGDLIYVNGVLQTIMHDEGRVKVDGTNKRYQFFITDHLGSTRIIIERVSDTAALVQELHYGVWGEKLEGIGLDGDWKFLFQGKEYVDFEGYNVYDFHTRSYDPWTGRFNQLDGADQFVSGYVGMGNIPTIGVDPDGQWVHIVAGAVIGGIVNLGVKAFQGKINSFKDGAVAFGIGAAAGAVTAATGGAAASAMGLSSTGVLSGAVTGTVGSAVGDPIRGIGNSMYFGDSYTLKDYGTGILMSGAVGGVAGGAGALIKGNNFWNGAPKGLGTSPFSINNGKVLREQGNWVKVKGGKWSNVGTGDMTFGGADLGDGVLRDFAGRRIGETVSGNLPTPYYPANNGALGSWTNTILQKGHIIDRFGGDYGSYFSPKGTPLNMRALDYIPNSPSRAYEVLKPLPVQQSVVAPAFGKIGLGIQYKTPISVSDLVRLKYLRPIR